MHKYASLTVILISLLIMPVARAQTKTCEFSSDVSELENVRGQSANDPLSGIRAELLTRKDFLHRVLSCASGEASDLKSKLDSLKSTDAMASTLQTQLSQALGAVVEYYGQKSSDLDSVGLRGSEEMAGEVRSWRNSSYLPLAARTSNFILWSSNHNFFDKAQVRVNQAQQILSSLNILEHSDLRATFDDAARSLNDGKEHNSTAFISIQNGSDPQTSLSEIQASLASLSKVYKDLLDLGDAASKIFPR